MKITKRQLKQLIQEQIEDNKTFPVEINVEIVFDEDEDETRYDTTFKKNITKEVFDNILRGKGKALSYWYEDYFEELLDNEKIYLDPHTGRKDILDYISHYNLYESEIIGGAWRPPSNSFLDVQLVLSEEGY